MDVAYKNNAGAVVEEHIVGVSILIIKVDHLYVLKMDPESSSG